MKKIVKGLMYDTDKSELVHIDKARKRQLYNTQNGNYFMFYVSGDILPVTEDFVKDYLGENDIEKYIELFGEVEDA